VRVKLEEQLVQLVKRGPTQVWQEEWQLIQVEAEV
jgi:hypothetical protein